jgi:hypothetical protein
MRVAFTVGDVLGDDRGTLLDPAQIRALESRPPGAE